MDYNYNDKTSLKSWHPIVTKNFKELADDIGNHTGNASVHVTTTDKDNWNNHKNNTNIHVTATDKANWNSHKNDTTIHVTATDKTNWDNHTDEITALNAALGDKSGIPAIGTYTVRPRATNAVAAVNDLWNVLKTVTGRPVFLFDKTEFARTTSGGNVMYVEKTSASAGAERTGTHKLHQDGIYIIIPDETITSITFEGIDSANATVTRTYSGELKKGYVYLVDVGTSSCALMAAIGMSGGSGGDTDLADCYNYYGVCETDADVYKKTVTIPNLSSLTDGTAIKVRFSDGVYGSEDDEGESLGPVTLNVNGLGAKTVYFAEDSDSDAYGTRDCLVGEDGVVDLVYNRNCWTVEGAYRVAESTRAYTLAGNANNMLVPRFLTSTAATATFTNITTDIDYAYGTMTSIDMSDAVITPHTGGRRLISISFTSGETPTNFVYPDGWLWKGDDCEDYVFVPQANTYYEMIIEYRNGTVTGYVSGFEVSADE